MPKGGSRAQADDRHTNGYSRPYGDLPVSALANPSSPAYVKAALFELGRAGLTVRAVREHLAGESHEDLSGWFNTVKRNDVLQTQLMRFDSAVRNWTIGSRWDGRYNWLLPPGLRSLRPDTLQLQRALLRSPLGARLIDAADVKYWLPLLSVEGIIELRRLRAADMPLLTTAVDRNCRALQLARRVRPWERNHPRALSALPLGVLYQHAPTGRMETLIKRLQHAGYVNLGHLRVLHPAARRWAGHAAVSEWIRMRSAAHNPH